jgi:hypothetical protein
MMNHAGWPPLPERQVERLEDQFSGPPRATYVQWLGNRQGRRSLLLGLNFHAQAVNYFADSPGFTLDHAYIYDANGGVFLQIVIPLAVNGSQATGINDQQEVCGFYIDSGMVTHGFLLNFGTLTTLNFPGASSTQALGLNDQGQVVGVYTVGAAMHGFVYNSKHGHFYSVDDPNGVGTTTINGINNFGQIVGFYVDSMKNTDGFIGTP